MSGQPVPPSLTPAPQLRSSRKPAPELYLCTTCLDREGRQHLSTTKGGAVRPLRDENLEGTGERMSPIGPKPIEEFSDQELETLEATAVEQPIRIIAADGLLAVITPHPLSSGPFVHVDLSPTSTTAVEGTGHPYHLPFNSHRMVPDPLD